MPAVINAVAPEPALKDMTSPDGVGQATDMASIATKEPSRVRRKCPVFIWLNDHVNVSGHRADAEHSHAIALLRSNHKSQKPFVVSVFKEDSSTLVAATDNVIGVSRGGKSSTA